MNAYSLRKNVIIHVLVASAMTRHDCRLQRFIADDTICIHLLVKSLTLSGIIRMVRSISKHTANTVRLIVRFIITENGADKTFHAGIGGDADTVSAASLKRINILLCKNVRNHM